MKSFCFIIALLLVHHILVAQPSSAYAVQLGATVQQIPPQICLSWERITQATGYILYKKVKDDFNWGSPIATLSALDTSYTDVNVIVDSAFEYKIVSTGVPAASGYIFAGIRAPAIHQRGRIIMLVDSVFTTPCSASLRQFMKDLRGDGWEVARFDLSRSLKDSVIKALIRSQYQLFPNTTAILVLGHLAVPYSGIIFPDGHTEHRGAWPADVYYADMDEEWTDTAVNVVALRPENNNFPADGKWDRSALSTPVELQVSRIDFYDMPAFMKSEVELMNSYLSRAHVYKMDSLGVMKRALIDDNFGSFSGEAFAAIGWRGYPTLVGKNNIHEADLITTLRDSSYQWAYGCGSGGYQAAGGIGSTTDFTIGGINGIFVQLFGSYFGDWDNQNNFLRAPLCAQIPALTSCWAGRPNWLFHHMALGENIGYAVRLTQSNLNSIYFPANASTERRVHPALMGDLSLRTDYIKPITNFSVAHSNDSSIILTWNSSPDQDVLGYYVYRSSSEFGSYQQISTLVPNTTFHDISLASGCYYYMIRPVKLQSTPSGNYLNLGVGVADSIMFINTTGSEQLIREENVTVYPNPARNVLNVLINSQSNGEVVLTLIDINGKQIISRMHRIARGANNFSFNVGFLPSGAYAVLVRANQSIVSKTWVKVE